MAVTPRARTSGADARVESGRGLDRDRIAADPDGSLVAAVDGAELLVWAGHDLQAVWKAFGEARYADVAVAADGVWALDREGSLEHRRRADGELLHRVRLFRGGGEAVAAVSGLVVAASGDEVVWLLGGTVAGRMVLPGVVDVAIDERSGRAALLEARGALTVFDLRAGRALGRVTVGGRPAGVAWTPEGYWGVAVQQRLRPVRADGGAVAPPRPAREAAIRHLAVIGDGAGWALALDGNRVEVVGADVDLALGTVTLGRTVTGVVGAGRGLLFIGVDHGEVQRVDLLSGASLASAPHEGRARIPWASDVRVDQGRVRGLFVRRQAGPQEIAVQQDPYAASDEVSWMTVLVWAAGALLVVAVALGIAGWVLRGRGLI